MKDITLDAKSVPSLDSRLVEQAVNRGIERYIQSRNARVPGFVDKYFSVKGALKLHRKALGKDLYRAPLNIVWAVPSLGAQALASLGRKLGAERLADKLEKLPQGFETDVQREVKWLIYTELLELPYQDGERESRRDVLLAEILSEPELAAVCESYLEIIHGKVGSPRFKTTLEHNLSQLAIARTAAADLATSIITLATGYATFHQATPGAVAGGSALAGVIAHHLAVSGFWLGPTLGAWYYSVFPVTASTGLIVASTGAVMAALAVVSTLAGVIVDPLLAVTGMHRRRLEKFIGKLGNELKGRGESKMKIHDQYLARVFDLLDLLKTAALAAR
ncbi:MAG: hypothetical protein AXA67_10485 [Methylothermaceae bacteria B42]|nr:MAG: hypothetical protein AXA67_10485 [Methylothermaceae bacteria B42]HHJ38901.1 hypothetical protein [Methylothermaceae bacterium]